MSAGIRQQSAAFVLVAIAASVVTGVLVFWSVAAPSVRAQTDRYVAEGGTDTANDCTAPANPCATIGHAITQSDAGDTINVAAGTYTEGGLEIDKDLTIQGEGAETTIIQADVAPKTASDRVFHILVGSEVTIDAVTIRHGNDPISGGGIENAGTLTLSNSAVSDNRAPTGGGISNAGTMAVIASTVNGNKADDGGGGGTAGGILNGDFAVMTVASSTISNNEAGATGGGIWNISGDLTVTDSTITGNTSGTDGGGISNGGDGTATVTGGSIQDNEAANGAGIFNGAFATMTLTESTVSDNTAGEGGGGITTGGELTVTNSTISGNDAIAGEGGGILNSTGTLTLANSTVSSNIAEVSGGGISIGSAGELTVVNSTISNNTVIFEPGGGIFNNGGDVTLTNTIIADQGFGEDCAGTAPTSAGHNLDSDGTCELTEDGDIPNGDANLGPLADNGGPTLTRALLEGSDAIDAGDDAVCAAPPVNGVDQRGAPRPAGKACDIGAFEFGAIIPIWGDIDCDGSVVIGDALKTARYLLGLSVSQEEGCPEPGADVMVDGEPRMWGDVDCDETIAIGDALKVARWLLDLSVSQEEGCPEIGTEVEVAE